MTLNPRQFVAYRGLLVDTGRAPEDDHAVLDRLRASPTREGHAYGRHWTTDPEVARRFATDGNAGGYETVPASMRRFHGGADKWGVVLEAQVHGPATDISAPWSEHEREISVFRGSDHPAANNLQSVTAHVYDQVSLATVAKQHPLGEPGTIRRRKAVWERGWREPVRSFEVPPEHWQS